jgi:hypothetical protein
MDRGFVKLWRKSIDAGWLRNHKLWAFWSWCLMKASYREHKQIVGRQTVELKPGQFIFGRKKAAEELNISEQETRTILGFLAKAQNLTIKSTNKFSIITVVNWPIYQGMTETDQPADQQTTNQQLTTNKNVKNIKNKKPPSEISAEISSLAKIYPPDLLHQVFSAISSTRKTRSIADTVKLKILQDWLRYPIHQVEAGLRVYLEKDCASQGRKENYLLGIIRNQNSQNVEDPDALTRKSTGNTTLDEYYRSQGYRITA